MKTVGVIPARWGSTRFEGKVLAQLKGKPMVQHVWERSLKADTLDEVIIACDDERIIDAAQSFGAKAVMTSVDHPSGSDRIAEAVKDLDVDYVINIQGDEPLIDPNVIDDLARCLHQDSDCSMATVVKKITDPADLENPNVVKVVTDQEGYALYFSRSAIPFNRDGSSQATYYKHLGLYGYQKTFLLAYTQLAKTRLETTEQLEQLRALEHGYKIKTIETEYETIGVDTPEQLAEVEQKL